MADNTQIAAVPVESGWLSKINITQVVQAAAMLLLFTTGGKVNISADQQVVLATAIVIVGNLVTVIFRQYFTKTVTPQSVPPAETVTVVPGQQTVVAPTPSKVANG